MSTCYHDLYLTTKAKYSNSSVTSLYLGDSFVKALRGYSVRKKITSYTGRTAKGLVKNNTIDDIRQYVTDYPNLNCLVLYFGNVDCQLSYFYKLFSQIHESYPELIPETLENYNRTYVTEIVEQYLKFIGQVLKEFKSFKIIKIILPTYSVIKDSDVPTHLHKYMFRKKTSHYRDNKLYSYGKEMDLLLRSKSNRDQVVDIFNQQMRSAEWVYGFETIDLNAYVYNSDKIIKNEYQYKPLELDIHLDPMNTGALLKETNLLQCCGLPKIRGNYCKK